MSATPTKTIASDDFECGYLIIDEADFDPAVHTLFAGTLPAQEREPTADEVIESMTVVQIKDELSRRGIGYKANTSKADLIALLNPTV